MFGLAQLYQLRGRVGRSKLRAYAYLTTAAEQALTVSAEKRLKISPRSTISAPALPWRRTISTCAAAAICWARNNRATSAKWASNSINRCSKKPSPRCVNGTDEAVSKKSWSPQINVGASVLIPEDYVADLTVRLALYRRLADLDTDQEREAFAAELIDRFGPLPAEADQLIAVAALKALCRRCQISKARRRAEGRRTDVPQQELRQSRRADRLHPRGGDRREAPARPPAHLLRRLGDAGRAARRTRDLLRRLVASPASKEGGVGSSKASAHQGQFRVGNGQAGLPVAQSSAHQVSI